MSLKFGDYLTLETLIDDYRALMPLAKERDVRRQMEFLYVAWERHGQRTLQGFYNLLPCVSLHQGIVETMWLRHVAFVG